MALGLSLGVGLGLLPGLPNALRGVYRVLVFTPLPLPMKATHVSIAFPRHALGRLNATAVSVSPRAMEAQVQWLAEGQIACPITELQAHKVERIALRRLGEPFAKGC